MKHKDEICYWADHPDGTKVWQFEEENVEPWKLLCCTPEWFPHKKYIVDNEWAELRKAQADGKQLERFNEVTSLWKQKELDFKYIKKDLPKRWRIKPEIVYEYQWMYQVPEDNSFYITEEYCTTKEEAYNLLKCYLHDVKIIEPYEPSKRERKQNEN